VDLRVPVDLRAVLLRVPVDLLAPVERVVDRLRPVVFFTAKSHTSIHAIDEKSSRLSPVPS
jgi:hypothetical protein